MKKKIKFSLEEQIESFTHMKFSAFIIIDDRIVNFQTIHFEKLDFEKEKSIELLKEKFQNMYQDLLCYREKYKLETMCIQLEFTTAHSVDNLPF